MKVQEECYGEFYTYGANGNISGEDNKVSVIVAHQPLYDICERIRLPYGSEIQTTDFLSALQDFINGNGIYLCGDKHTSSIAASYIHDIPHYFWGHPFVFEKNEFPLGCIYKDSKQDSKQNSEQKKNSEIDYNLIEIRDGKTGQVRKIHLIKDEDGLWKCQIHPIDAVVSGLYETSRKYIVKNSFVLLATQSKTRYNSWANLSWRNLFNRLDTGINDKDLKEISNFYSLFCRLTDGLGESIEWNDNVNIFNELCKIITKFMKENHYHDNIKNIMNIRGDYSSGKSTFLGLLYIFLLYNYSYGYIDYIPAYFNMENDDILNRIQTGSTYASAVKHKDPWIIAGENSKRMKKFIDLNFLHSQKILDAINSNSSFGLVCELLKKPNFALYNRQYMMWYYGDLTIYGENIAPCPRRNKECCRYMQICYYITIEKCKELLLLKHYIITIHFKK